MTKDEALKIALDALQDNVIGKSGRMPKTHEAITAIKEALAQPEQEPVAWGHPNSSITGRKQALMMVALEIPSNAQYPQLWVPLYTTPPQRTKG